MIDKSSQISMLSILPEKFRNINEIWESRAQTNDANDWLAWLHLERMDRLE